MLLFKYGEAAAIAVGVARGRVLPLGLFAGVVDFQCQNGKPVDDQSGRLGVEFSLGIGQTSDLEPIDQEPIQLLAQVIAELVGLVYAALYIGDLCIRSAGRPGLILNV